MLGGFAIAHRETGRRFPSVCQTEKSTDLDYRRKLSDNEWAVGGNSGSCSILNHAVPRPTACQLLLLGKVPLRCIRHHVTGQGRKNLLLFLEGNLVGSNNLRIEKV